MKGGSATMKQQEDGNSIATVVQNTTIPRRTFLKLAGAAGGAAVVATAIKKPDLLALYETTETTAAVQEEGGEWLPTTCQGCTSWCSKQVYVVDGRAIKVRGNPNSMVNGKASCPRAHMGLQLVYDPDRV